MQNLSVLFRTNPEWVPCLDGLIQTRLVCCERLEKRRKHQPQASVFQILLNPSKTAWIRSSNYGNHYAFVLCNNNTVTISVFGWHNPNTIID